MEVDRNDDNVDQDIRRPRNLFFSVRGRWVSFFVLMFGYFLVLSSAMYIFAPADFDYLFDIFLRKNVMPLLFMIIGCILLLMGIFNILPFGKNRFGKFEQVDVGEGENFSLSSGWISKKYSKVEQPKDNTDFNNKSRLLPVEKSDWNMEGVEDFKSYYVALSSVIEHKAYQADRKASILLDSGTGYAKAGIAFMVASVVVWQTLSFVFGFTNQIVYGAISCSLIFLFIEFLSAWFLRQYKSFVDSSTYLMKVKSIFDRFMLSYLTIKDYVDVPFSEKKALVDRLVVALSEDIKWPETTLTKHSDVSFAAEAMESMIKMAKIISKKEK